MLNFLMRTKKLCLVPTETNFRTLYFMFVVFAINIMLLISPCKLRTPSLVRSMEFYLS